MNPIRQLRLQLGLTQEKLALVGGTSQPTIAAYEAGKKSPTIDTLEKLAGALGAQVSISFVPSLTKEDLRSLAFHKLIVEKLRTHPEAVLQKARKNLAFMSKNHPDAQHLFRLWNEWLNLSTNDLIGQCLNTSLLARDMRQVTPFAGILNTEERLRAIQEFRRKVTK